MNLSVMTMGMGSNHSDVDMLETEYNEKGCRKVETSKEFSKSQSYL